MFKYLWKDLLAALRFLPWGIAAGIVVAIILCLINKKRLVRGKESLPMAETVCFYVYVAILLSITFFSRESGSGKGVDLELFSTWGINARNNAYVIENILLFIPYGVVCTWRLRKARKFMTCTAMGFVSSLSIEVLQLVTQRGVFQLDDILTNVLGSMIGCLLWQVLGGGHRRRNAILDR